MPILDFPGSPGDNDRYTENGIEYYYDASVGAWLLVVPSIVANTLNTQVIFNDDGKANGSNGLVFDKGANTLSANMVYVSENVSATYFIGDGSYLTGISSGGEAFDKANSANILAEAAIIQANAVWDSANSNYTYSANTVMLAANSAYTAANSNYTYAANDVMLVANSAFVRANVVNAGNSGTTVQYTERATQKALNFVEGTDIRINVDQDDSLETVNIKITSIATEGASAADAFDKANLAFTIAANDVMLAANSAYGEANVTMNVGNTTAGTFTPRSKRRAINFLEGSGITITIDDDEALNTANVTITSTGGDTTIAEAAFDQANTVWDSANGNYTFSANTVRLIANTAYDTANSNYTYAANTVMLVANSAYDKANAANITADVADAQSQAAFDQANAVWDSANSNYTFAANTVMLAANSAYDAANSNYTYAANTVMLAANAAFAQANAANLIPVGNTISSNGYYTNRASRRGINFLEGSNITVNVDDDPTLNLSNVTITTSATDDTVAAAAFDQANTVWDSANSNYTFAANTVRLIANSAYDAGNTNYTYAANDVMLAANSAFAQANAANLIPVGNTISANGYYTNRASRRGINFLEGTGITINVDDDPTLNLSNITITSTGGDTTIAEAAFERANVVNAGNSGAAVGYSQRASQKVLNFIEGTDIVINVDQDDALETVNVKITSTATEGASASDAFNKANLAYTFAANDAMLAANSAYGEANVTMNVGNTTAGTFTPRSKRRAINFLEGSGITITIDDDEALNTANVTITSTGGDTTIAEAAFDQANTVWDSANSNYTFAANTVRLIANTAYDSANSNYTFAANTVRLIANSAYDAANSNYTYAANNVMLVANSAYDAANTNYTYAANDVMLAANSAFAMANAANLIPVGNTISANGYYTNRATRRGINFLEGGLITVNVDDDPTINVSNVTITTSATDDTVAEAAFDQANTVWDSANSNYTYSANAVMLAANSAFDQANTVWDSANSNYTFAANTVRLIANTAYDAANSNYTFAANTVRLIANTAYDKANSANLLAFAALPQSGGTIDGDLIVTGNVTISGNTTFTNTETLLVGDNIIELNSDLPSDVAPTEDAGIKVNRGSSSNVFLQWDEGSDVWMWSDDSEVYWILPSNTQVETAQSKGEAAHLSANNAYTYAANNAMLAANSAYDAANSNYTFAANTVRLIANTAYDTANSNYTYAANNVMLAANSAFAMANAANLIPVGNTISSNGYYTNRATRRGINFLEGSNITVTVDDDPTINVANITITTSATDDTVAAAAFDQANTVWDSANSNYTFAANTVMLAANSAYDAGNTNYTYAANNVMLAANSAYDAGNTNYTFAANTVRLIANTAYDAANSNYTYAANTVMLAANSAFAQANAANLIPVGNTISSNGYYTNRATRRGINFLEGSGITINVDDDPTINVSNVTITSTGGDTTIAEAAFDQANTVWDSANSNYTFAANTVRLIANTAYDAANSNYTYAANNVMLAANAAFAQANAANLIPVGNTISSNGYYTNRATRRGINFLEGTGITIKVDDDPTINVANVTITSTGGSVSVPTQDTAPGSPADGDMWWNSDLGKLFIYYEDVDTSQWVEASPGLVSANGIGSSDTTIAEAAFDQANTVWDSANSNYTFAANTVRLIANTAYDAANSNYTFAANTVRLIANTAYDAANSNYTFAANTVRLIANSAFDQANTVWDSANSNYTFAANTVRLIANTAYDSANSNYTYSANDVMLAANSAYGEANVVNVGLTVAGTFTPTSKRSAINFIEGTGITITVDDDADLNTANVTITSTGGDTTIAEAAFDQANTVWDSANSNYTFAANTVRLIANTAYDSANSNYTYAANNAMLAANSAYAAQNTTYTYAANTVMLAANSAYAAQNTTYTFAANTVRLIANTAYAKANTNYTYAANNVMRTANVASKSISISSPTTPMNVTLWYSNTAIRVTRLAAVVQGSTPSITYYVRSNSSRAATTPTNVVTAGSTSTSTTTGDVVTTFNNQNISAGNWIWLWLSAESGTIDEFHLTIDYQE